MELAVSVESSTASDESTPTLINNTKENRYYYKHREEILEKKRLARLAKKGVDVETTSADAKLSLEERRKKKMEFLGLVDGKK
jgi:hypothetical protein